MDRSKKINICLHEYIESIINNKNIILQNDIGKEILNGYYLDNYPSIIYFFSYLYLYEPLASYKRMILKYSYKLIQTLSSGKKLSTSLCYGLLSSQFALKKAAKSTK
ncbi:MAG: hypothetical protein ACTIDH_04225 [Lactobacillus sp.]